MRGIIGQNRDRLLLYASAIPDFERGCDFAFFTGIGALFGRSSGASARCRNGLNGDRFVSLVLIFEMTDGGVVPNRGMQFDLRLLPDKLAVRGGNNRRNNRNQKNLGLSVHSMTKEV